MRRLCLIALLLSLPACARHPEGMSSALESPRLGTLPDPQPSPGTGDNEPGREAEFGDEGLTTGHRPPTGKGWGMRSGTSTGQAHPGRGDVSDDVNIEDEARSPKR
jgi:hypothetical protein